MIRSDLCDFSDVYIVVKGFGITTEMNQTKNQQVVVMVQ